MRAITSKEKLIKKLKGSTILTVDGYKFYLSDFHRTPVGKNLVNKMISAGELEQHKGVGNWFEQEFILKIGGK